jgi:hypothetical protein
VVLPGVICTAFGQWEVCVQVCKAEIPNIHIDTQKCKIYWTVIEWLDS